MQNSIPRQRIIYIGFIVMGLSVLIIVRLFGLQIIHHKEYTLKSNKQYSAFYGDSLNRGSIYFTSKNNVLVVASSTILGYKLTINPSTIGSNKEEIYNKLNTITPIDKKLFFEKVAKTNDPYEEIAYKLDQDKAQQIKNLKIQGVDVFTQSWRFYPGENIFSRAMGFVAYSGDKLLGRYGLERQYNEVLEKKEQQSSSNFFVEVFNTVKGISKNKINEEGSIITTIEPTVQNTIEDSLETMMHRLNAKEAGAIVMDPKTGAIIAMATSPNYNINEFNKVTNVSLYNNPIVENVYELGSIIKSLTMSAGLDAGVITPETTYNDIGYVILNTEKINDHDHKARGIVNMQDVLNNSLNTGANFVMQKLGRDKFRDYMMAFGLGEKTNIDLPGEVRNIVSNLKSTRDVEYATASFGQGIAITPISAIRAFAVLANGGYLINPHIVDRIERFDGSVKIIEQAEPKRVIKKETTETISRMLVTVTDKGLFGGRIKLEHYSVALKTGTAQVAKENGIGYYDDIYIHTMFGYYPAYDPKFVTLLYVVDPKGVEFASNTLGQPFMDIASFLLTYYEVTPDR